MGLIVSWMLRSLLCAVVGLVLLTGDAHANEAATKRAAAVLKAYEDGDLEELKLLAAQDSPDPWLVADALVIDGQADVAMAFARAAKRQDTTRLPTYLERRREQAHDAKVRAALEQAEQTVTRDAADAALAALDEQAGRGDLFERAQVEFARARILTTLGKPREAAEAYGAAGRSAEELGWFAGAARAYLAAGHAAFQILDYDRVLDVWGRMLTLEEGRGNRQAVAQTTMFLGAVHGQLGNYDEGKRFLLEALGLYRALGSEDGEAWTLDNLATVYTYTGDRSAEYDALQRALKLARKVGNQYRQASLLESLGSWHSNVGAYDRSLERYEQALALYEKLRDPTGAAVTVINIGVLQNREGRYEEAIAKFREGLKAIRRLGRRPRMEASTLTNLGWAQYKRGDLQEAKRTLTEAVSKSRVAHDSWQEVHALQSLAETLIALGEFDAAEREVMAAQVIAKRLASPFILGIGHRVMAQLHLAQGAHQRAFEAAQRSVEQTWTVQSGLGHGQAAMAGDTQAALHRTAITAAIRWQRPAALHLALEQSRSGALLEALEHREEIREATLSKLLQQLEGDARRRAHESASRYRQALRRNDAREMRERRADLDQARASLHQVIGRIQAEAKAAAGVLYPQPVSLDVWQRALEPDEVYVAYSLMGDEAVALVVDRKGARIVSLGPTTAIEEAGRVLFDDPEEKTEARAAKLKTLLVDPLALSKSVKRLLISPDGVLGYVPFAIFVPRREVVYVPSASAATRLRAESPTRGEGVLALGDPDYRLAPTEEAGPLTRGGMRLVALPATRKEATQIGDVVLLGDKATPGGLMLTASTRERWRAIHLACHGLVDAEHPMRSAMALSLPKKGSNLLTCSDVFQQKMATDLAVLSACNTGRGRVHRVEGIVGFTQAFMVAGASRVLCSLWKVDDAATQALMLKFYELWNPKEGTGLPAIAALHAAQQHVKAQEKWAHPYYWGAWVLWGLPD